MAEKQTALTIRILGRDYSIACPEGERESLLSSAEYLSRRMHAIQRKGKTLGIDRIAVMAALNIARDLIAAERQLERQQAGLPATDGEISDRLSQLQLRIESALDDHR
ncbi:cell division protein ZapA [Endozoicomonas sp. G2_2]|uniref:cell division protein ZapA n=1 Tax=Endozoicomonas sp. G2_2 TaxID=2821092 RepID=UPI001ADD436B|nr:cell division protein ZapA [Endozoicomonas sp. G2_2]MBO9471821.1 cell division protein ZapA [Endozoicomonas sp. G2_2]|tara:strand:- start:232 stop:555 length:324 start_codon:yes stop_codon:yes gene_type:complete